MAVLRSSASNATRPHTRALRLYASRPDRSLVPMNDTPTDPQTKLFVSVLVANLKLLKYMVDLVFDKTIDSLAKFVGLGPNILTAWMPTDARGDHTLYFITLLERLRGAVEYMEATLSPHSSKCSSATPSSGTPSSNKSFAASAATTPAPRVPAIERSLCRHAMDDRAFSSRFTAGRRWCGRSAAARIRVCRCRRRSRCASRRSALSPHASLLRLHMAPSPSSTPLRYLHFSNRNGNCRRPA